MTSNLQPQKTALIAAAQKIYDQKLVAAHAGNLSLYLLSGNILITAANRSKGGLQPADILLVDAQGQPLEAAAESRPSSETGLHLAIYRSDPAIKAIIHAHPPYATALASSGQEFDWQLLEESRLLLGPVPTVPYQPAGSAELAAAVSQAAPGHAALLLANHGAVCWGADLEQALFRLEALEHSARIMTYAHLWQQQLRSHHVS